MIDSRVKLERATTEAIRDMLNLWQSIPGLGVGLGDDEDSLQVFMSRNPATSLLLKNDEQIIGTVLAGYDGRRGYIYHLAVYPQFQKKGYGKWLLNQVLSELKALGAKKIHLFVYRNNEEAISFYIHNKWKLRGDIQVLSWDDS
jgi:ribosomal protein S18 acetylase RimI-like enzyme